MVRYLLIACAFIFIGNPIAEARQRHQGDGIAGKASGLTPTAVNSAEFVGKDAPRGGSSPLVLKMQVLLDRAHFSPGEIDGRMGDNTVKALTAFQRANNLSGSGKLNRDAWERLVGYRPGTEQNLQPRTRRDSVRNRRRSVANLKEVETGADRAPYDSVVEAVIEEKDVKGPFVEKIPAKMEEKAQLKELAYTSPEEALGEKYHSSPELLKALNPGVDLSKAGSKIWVPNVHRDPPSGKAVRLVADKGLTSVSAYGANGKLLAVYPATVGSEEKPTPDGDTEVVRIARNPTYTYDPERVHFEEVHTDHAITIAPGPNNPVGLVWIALKEDGYGIHGTPEPRSVSKNSSHGCVRLTNWDALELAEMVQKGTKVEFVGGNGRSVAQR